MKLFTSIHIAFSGDRRIVSLFFVAVFVIGLASFHRFGVATDAGTMDALGHDAYAYVFGDGEWPTNPAWRYHGTAVELPLQMMQNAVAAPDDVAHGYRRVLVQHAMVFVLWFIGLVALYLLALKHFDDRHTALLCCLLYCVTPRFFAHSFYNSRDIPQVTFFTVSMLTLLIFHERRTYRSAILHGIATALALALRMPSLIIGLLTLIFFSIGLWQKKISNNKIDLKRTFLLLATYGITVAIATTIFWPFLWENPIKNFWEAYTFMSSLGQQIVFMGETHATMPWNYIPLWMFVTIPLLYTALFVVGAGVTIMKLMTRPHDTVIHHANDVLFLAWCLLPVLSIIITRAGIYNEWRHVFFIYPAFILTAVIGFRSLMTWAIAQRSGMWKRALQWALAIQLASTGFWMVRNHPMQYAYFSLPQSIIESTFLPGRVDYWGLSYREAWKYLLAQEQGIISVYSPENIAFQNAYNVFPETLGRVMRVPTMGEAMYILLPEPDSRLQLVKEMTADGYFLSGIYQGPVQEVLFDRSTGDIQLIQ